MSFLDNANKKFNKSNILPIIGAAIGVFSTLGAAGVALSPLLSVKIAGYAAGFASALGLTTLGAGLILGAIFAIVAAVSIYQILNNKAMEKARASINAQAEEIKEAKDLIEKQAEEIKGFKASISTQATEAFGAVIRGADIPGQVKRAITTADIPGQIQSTITAADISGQVEKAITEKKLVDEDALNSAIEGFATKNELETKTQGLATKTSLEQLENRVKANEDALGETLKKAELGTEIMTVLKTEGHEVIQFFDNKYQSIAG